MNKLMALLLASTATFAFASGASDINLDPHKAKLASCVGVYHAYANMFEDRSSIQHYQQKAAFTANLANKLIAGENVNLYKDIVGRSYLAIKLTKDLDLVTETVQECDLVVIDGLKDI